MKMTNAFLEGLKDCAEYTQAVEIIRRNSSGNIWLIGGFVYRTIANQFYGAPKPQVDLDFIIEKTVKEFNLPRGWIVSENRFGNPKFVSGSKQIDYVPLDNIYSIRSRGLEPTIGNFLTGAPLNIQSIAFDVLGNELIGGIGLRAMANKIVKVLDIDFANYAAQKKGKTLRAYIQEKADSLGFTPVF